MTKQLNLSTRLLTAICLVIATTAVTPVDAAGSLGSPTGSAQQNERQRQLEIVERALTEKLQEYVTAHLNQSLAEGRDLDGDGEPDMDNQSLVVNVGNVGNAHGMFIDDYGVIFSIQTPQVAVIGRELAFAVAPTTALRIAPQMADTGARLRLIEGRLVRMFDQVAREWQLAVAQGGSEKERQEHAAQMERIRQEMADLARNRVDRSADDRDAADLRRVGTDRPDPTPNANGRGTGGMIVYRDPMADQIKIGKLIEANRERVNRAVTNGAIDTLAYYGNVLTGLKSDQRVSVIVLPANNWMLQRSLHTGLGNEEFVISVRYEDVRNLDREKIDLEKFRERASIHSRLGTPIELVQEEERP